MWDTVALISSGITLIAFLVATAATVYRARLRHKENLLNSAPESERALVLRELEAQFPVDTASLSGAAKERIIIDQIRVRERLQTKLILYGFLFALAFLALSAYAISKGPDQVPPSPDVEIGLNDTVQFRHFMEFTDNSGNAIPREERLSGPSGVLISPIVKNSHVPAQAIFVSRFVLELKINRDGEAATNSSYAAEFFTRVRPTDQTETFHDIQDIFGAFSVGEGSLWTRQVLFAGTGSTSHQAIVTALADEATIEAELRLEAFNESESLGFALCEIDLSRIREEVASGVPNYAQTTCLKA